MTQKRRILSFVLASSLLSVLTPCAQAQGEKLPEIRYEGKTIKEWIAELKNETDILESKPIYALVTIGSLAAPQLLDAMKLKSKGNIYCATALGRIGCAEILPELMELSVKGEEEVRVLAIVAMSFYSLEFAELIIPVLKSGLTDKSEKIRLVSIDGLGMLAGIVSSSTKYFQEAAVVLVKELRDSKEEVRESAYITLVEMGSLASDAEASLIETAKTNELAPKIRVYAIRALVSICTVPIFLQCCKLF